MSASASIVTFFYDDDYSFTLRMKEIEELQRQTGTGLGELAGRLLGEKWFIGDIWHTIRLGLIGGGMPPVAAQKLCDAAIDGKAIADPNDPASPLMIAKTVMSAAYMGVSVDEDAPSGTQKKRTKRRFRRRSAVSRQLHENAASASVGRRNDAGGSVQRLSRNVENGQAQNDDR